MSIFNVGVIDNALVIVSVSSTPGLKSGVAVRVVDEASVLASMNTKFSVVDKISVFAIRFFIESNLTLAVAVRLVVVAMSSMTANFRTSESSFTVAVTVCADCPSRKIPPRHVSVVVGGVNTTGSLASITMSSASHDLVRAPAGPLLASSIAV